MSDDVNDDMNDMDETYDVVIIGGAIMGAMAAYFLTRDPAFHGKVAVIERDPSFAFSSTTLSAASIRQQFSIRENIRMSRFGLEFLHGAKERFGPEIELGWHEGGYLILASEAGVPVLRANHAVQQAEGANIALLKAGELKARFPWLNVEDIALGAFGVSGEGWFDAHALLAGVRRMAKRQGAHLLTGEVTASSARITASARSRWPMGAASAVGHW